MESLQVVGNEHFGGAFRRKNLAGKTVAAELMREPQNRFDRNAAAVYVSGAQVGYVSEYRAAQIVRWLDAVGGKFDTSLTYEDGGAEILIPDAWVATDQRVKIQQSKKYQAELACLGVGSRRCLVVADGAQFNVMVDDVVVGRLYPKNMDSSTVRKVAVDRLQDMLIEDSAYDDGVYAWILITAKKAPNSPTPLVPNVQKVESPTIGSLLRRLFTR